MARIGAELVSHLTANPYAYGFELIVAEALEPIPFRVAVFLFRRIFSFPFTMKTSLPLCSRIPSATSPCATENKTRAG